MNRSGSEQDHRALLDGLSSADAEVRRLSVEQLSLLPIEEAMPYLSNGLGDSDWRVRKAIVARIEPHLDCMAMQEMLIDSLADGEDPGRRNSAFESLVRGGRRVVPRLIKELSSPDVDVRKLVVDAMAAIGDPSSRAALVLMTDDDDVNVRSAAIESLGIVGGSEEINRLLEIVRSNEEDVLVRLSSLRALDRMEICVGVASVGSAIDDSILRPSVFALLARSEDDAAIAALLKGLETSNRSGREAAIKALLVQLARFDHSEAENLRQSIKAAAQGSAPGLVGEICDWLETASIEGQMAMIQFLGVIEAGEAVIPVLKSAATPLVEDLALSTVEVLGDQASIALEEGWGSLRSSDQVRACAVLARVGGEDAERILKNALVARDSEVRSASASAIGRGHFSRLLPDLLRALDFAAQHQRIGVPEEVSGIVQSIVEMADRSRCAQGGLDLAIVETLSSWLEGASQPVRLAIAQILSEVGRAQDCDVIECLLKDESPAVRRAAVGALAHFEYSLARDFLKLSLLDESVMVRNAAARVLGEMDDAEALDALLCMLDDSDDRFVSVVICSLGRFRYDSFTADHSNNTGTGIEDVFDRIKECLDRSVSVALAATETLGRIGGEAAAGLIVPCLGHSDPDIVRSAVVGIGKHGDENALERLLVVVGHEDWSVRAEAARVLGERNFRKGLSALFGRLEVESDIFVRESVLLAIGRLEE